MLEHRPHARQPLVETCLALHALIAPVGSNTFLGNLVHTLRTYLYLYPLLLWSEHGDVQTLVAVRLWHREPVAQPLGVGLVHVCDDGVCLPALHHLSRVPLLLPYLLAIVSRLLNNDPDGKEIVDALKAALLFLHLLPDGVYRLGAPFDVALDARCLHLLLYRAYKRRDIGVARGLRLVELLTDHVVGIVLHVLQREVFQAHFSACRVRAYGPGAHRDRPPPATPR